MNLWTRVEQTLEALVEGVFRKGLRGGIQPVEIARQLQRAMEERRHVSVSHTYVPNEFTVRLNPDDLRELQPILRTLNREFTSYLTETAAKQQLSFVGPPTVTFAHADDVLPGSLQVEADFAEGLLPTGEQRERDGGATMTSIASSVLGLTQQFPAEGALPAALERDQDAPSGDESQPAASAALVLLEPGEHRYFPLTPDHPAVIGRGSASDILLPDSSVSRSHARIEVKDGSYTIVDLGSTNGTVVNGRSITISTLQDGDHIRIGEYALRFEGDK